MSGRIIETSATKKGDHARLHPTNELQFTRRAGVGVMPRSLQLEEMRNLQFGMNLGSVSRYPTKPQERFLAQHEVFQELLDDNRRLAAVHVALKQEVSVAQKDLKLMALHKSTLKKEKDAQLSELYNKSIKMEMDLREAEAMKTELVQLRAEIKQLAVEKHEITGQVKMMSHELTRITADLQQVPILKAEIEFLTEELECGRDTIEYEKKMDAKNYERWQEMEKGLVSMSQEIEMLRTEIVNAEKRARAIAAANAAINNPVVDHNANYRNPKVQSLGNNYPASYEKNHVNAEVHYDAGNAYPANYVRNPAYSDAQIFPHNVPSTFWNTSNTQHAQGPR